MSFELFLGWIIFSIVIGFIGSGRKIGFGGAFFCSLLLSPIIGLIITLVSKNKAEEKYQEEILEAQRKQQKTLMRMAESKSNVSSSTSIIQELEKLKTLKENNIISEAEFLNLKKKVLSESNNSATTYNKKNQANIYVRVEKLSNGEFLQFIKEADSLINAEVRIKDTFPDNGFYKLHEKNIAFKIIDGEILDEYITTEFKQKDGGVIVIGSLKAGFNGIEMGNPVWLNGKKAPDGKYKVAIWERILVNNGVIVRFGVFN